MNQPENKIFFSKKGQREISDFVGHELLYDYLNGALDQERRNGVAMHLKYSRDAQIDLNNIVSGEAYSKKLSETSVSHILIEQLNATSASTYLSTLIVKTNFEKWPSGLKWGLEVLVVVAGIVLMLTIAPWEKALNMRAFNGPSQIIMAEVEKKESLNKPIAENPQFIDEYDKVGKGPRDKNMGHKTEEVKNTISAEAPTAPVVQTAVIEKKAEPLPLMDTDKKNEESKASETTAANSAGFLYRAEISITNIAVVGPKITEKILELGGRKAGGVELGWQKSASSFYYHFTIPEAKFQELSNYLGTYGKARIGKEKHSRTMPDGIIRLILTVDEAKN